MKHLLTGVSVVLLTSGLQANADLYGTWQFQDRAVYIDILRSGDVFQCRMSRGWTEVITSSGTLRGSRTIVWGDVRVTDPDGNDLKTREIRWGRQTARLKGDSLSLEGPDGDVTVFQRTQARIPEICRR